MKVNASLIRNIVRIFMIVFFVFCICLERRTVWAGRIVDLIVAAPAVFVVYLLHRICRRKILKL